MAITRPQTELGKRIPFLDHNKPGYSRLTNSVNSDDVHPQLIQYAEVSITAAEIAALRATPKELVAAPGTGYMIDFVSAVLLLDYTAPGFTETADNLAVKFTDGSGSQVSETIEATGFIDQTADTVTTARRKLDSITAASGAENKALVLHNTGDGEYAGGGGSTLRVKVVYRVIPTGF